MLQPLPRCLVVSLECLDAFDHLIWLRTGARAADVLGCNQSTISRHSSRCQQVFNVKLKRESAEWIVSGDLELLAAERHLHQHYRWEMQLPLRFETQHWMRAFYGAWQLAGWTKGNLNYLEYGRPLDLLKHSIIDAWLCGAPDVPEDPELTCVPLFEMPMRLVAHRDHPLLQHQGPLTLAEVAAYPLLPLPHKAFPVFEAQLKALGLAGPPAVVPTDAAGRTAEGLSFMERSLGVASALTLPLYGPDYVTLPLEIPISFGDVLVIRTEFAAHPRSQELLTSLLAYIRVATASCADVQLLEPRDLTNHRTSGVCRQELNARTQI